MHPKLLLPMLAGLLLTGPNCFASKVLYGNPSGNTANVTIPETYVGMTATFIATGYGYQGRSNMGFSMTLYHPNGTELISSSSQYVTAGDDAASDMFPLLYTGALSQAGTYSFRLGNTYDQKIIKSYLCIVWDAPGDDLTALQIQLNGDLNALRNELTGVLNTKTEELQNQINTLQTQLNDAITRHNTDQAALLKQIQDFKNEINNLAADLQYNVARLERAQAEYLAQLEILKTTCQKDAEMLNLRISSLDSKYTAEVANLKSNVAKIISDLAAMDAKFLAADQQLKTLISALEKDQTALQQQLNLAEQKHKTDVAAIQTQIDSKTELIRTEHAADVKRLENSISGIDAKYDAEVAALNMESAKTNSALTQAVRDYTSADEKLQSQIDKMNSSQTALQGELATLTTAHSRDIAELKSRIETAATQLSAQHNSEVKLLEQQIIDLENRFQSSASTLTTELAKTNQNLVQAIRDSNTADSSILEKINVLTTTQNSLQSQQTALEAAHTRDLAELNRRIADLTSRLEAQHSADVKLLEQKIGEADSRRQISVDALTSELNKTNTQLTQAIRDSNVGDVALQTKIDRLISGQTSLQNELGTLSSEHSRNVSELKTQIANQEAALTANHEADVKLLGKSISDLNSRYQDSRDFLTAELNQTNTQLAQAVRDSNTADSLLQGKIDSLNSKQNSTQNQLDALRTEHSRDITDLKTQIADKNAVLETQHTADVALLNQKIFELNSRYESSSSMLSSTLNQTNTKLAQVEKSYQEGDAALKSEINTLKQEQLSQKNEIALLETRHQQEVTLLRSEADTKYAKLESEHAADVNLLNRKMTELNTSYTDKISTLNSELNKTHAELTQLAKDSSATGKELQAKIEILNTQQTTQKNALSQLEQKHDQETAALRAESKARYDQLETIHTTDVNLLNQKMAELNSTYADKVSSLKSELEQTNSTLTQLAKELGVTDKELQSRIDTLSTRQSEQKNALTLQEQKHDQEIAQLRSEAKVKYDQLEAIHNADVNLLNRQISELNTTYADKVSAIQNELDSTNSTLSQLARESAARDKELQEKIDTLTQQQSTQKNALTLLESEHNKDVAALRSESKAQYDRLQTTHEADVRALTQQLSNVNSSYADKVSQINNQLDSIGSDLAQMARDYTNGDKELKEQIDTLRLQQLTQQNTLSNLQDKHTKDVAALQKDLATAQTALQEKIDTEVADLRQDMLVLDNKYKEATAELKSQLANVNSKLEREISKLSATDRDLYDKISDLREKQSDYYARMEILKVAQEKDKEAIEKEIADLDAKYKAEVEAIHAKIASVKEEISKLEAKHNADIAALQRQIDATVNKLDDEVKKIYLELTAVKDELTAHKKVTQLAIDNLQLQITELDKSVTERLKNLENRIQYATYSDEKLTALKKDFEKQIQTKEKEIADLDLEIQDMTNAGFDTSVKETTRTRLLKELLKLRNELTDIEFAIEIRHNESEFAEHEKEIALLKGELAALRNSSDLQIKQLKDELLATEAKYLKLLEEAKLDAANQTATVQKQLDDLNTKVLAFVDALRSERETGDAALKALIEAMDVSHKELISNLDKTIADKLEKMKFETDTQFENLRSTINNIAYQQRFSTGGSASAYSLPNSQTQDVPADSRDLRVSPDAALDSILN